MTFQGPGGQRVGPPSFRCLRLCSPPSKPDSAGLGELYYQHPACCLYPIQSSVGTHACSGARDAIEPKSGRLEGANGHFFFFFSVQSLSRVQLFATPWTAERQASLSITNSGTYSNSCPLSQRYHPPISSSVVPFSSCLQSFST